MDSSATSTTRPSAAPSFAVSPICSTDKDTLRKVVAEGCNYAEITARIGRIQTAGDLFVLGNHRLICGDCTDPNVVAGLLAGDTRADWSEAFELVPSLEVAYVWHASVYTREVLNVLSESGFSTRSRLSGTRAARF